MLTYIVIVFLYNFFGKICGKFSSLTALFFFPFFRRAPLVGKKNGSAENGRNILKPFMNFFLG